MNTKVSIDGQLIELAQEHVVEAAQVLAKNFVQYNPVWNSFKLGQEEARKFFEKTVLQHLASQERTRQEFGSDITLNFINCYEGKINGLVLHYELHQYLRMKNLKAGQPTLHHFNALEEVGDRLMKQIDFSKYQKGKHVYGTMGTIDKNVSPSLKRQRYLILAKLYRSLLKRGFKSMVARCSSEGSTVIYQKMGAEIISEAEMKKGDQVFKFSFIEIKFDNPMFQQIYDLLDQLQNTSVNKQLKPML